MCASNVRKPYIPISLEELSKVKSVEHWSNTYVRALGMVVAPSHLASVFENGGPYYVELNMSLLATSLLCERPVQVFGELNIVSDMPCLTVYFSREINGDIQSYQQALELQKKYIPHIINSLNDSDERLLRTLCRLETGL